MNNSIQTNSVRFRSHKYTRLISALALWGTHIISGIHLDAALSIHAETSKHGASFPPLEPHLSRFDPSSLKVFDDAVKRFVETGQVVGAEMLIIDRRQTVFHRAYGWIDRDRKLPMRLNTIFNIRSMTKPLTSTAIHLLADEARLYFDHEAARYLSAFDNERSREITIDHLLTHRSGLPLTVFTIGPRQFPSLQAIAGEAGKIGPETLPGMSYHYSDAGTDTLGAIVELVSDMTLREFWEARIFSPLGMDDTFALTDQTDPADPRLDRVATAYFNDQGEWSVLWSPESAQALYPFAWGSQSLYSTPKDYGKFLAMWLDRGQASGAPFLSPTSVRRILEPVSLARRAGSKKLVDSGFPRTSVYYGRLATLHLENESKEGEEPLAFGHDGSDGTWAWAFPGKDLMVLYFTQTRGQNTGLELERLIARYLLWDGSDEERLRLDTLYREIGGDYTANFGPFRDATFSVFLRDGIPSIDFGGQAVFGLEDPDETERWICDRDPSIAVSFDRDDSGKITNLDFHKGGHSFECPRN